MKRIILKFAAVAILASFAIPSFAQQEKETKDAKEATKEKKKDTEQIVITLKGDNKEKVVIEVVGDKILVNGKPSEDLKDGDIKVYRNKFKTFEGLNSYTVSGDMARAYSNGLKAYDFNWNGQDGMSLFGAADANRAMLGVVTEKVEQGAKVNDVTAKSAVEKAGIKEGDIITSIGDTKVEDPDALSEAVRKHKPGEKVSVTVLRDKKEQKLTAELGKWSGSNAFAMSPKMPDMNILREGLPRVRGTQVTPFGQNFSWSTGGPMLGLSVQDTDDGKGVKVIDVDEEGNAAKAGIKEDDIITHFNDKEVNSADEVAKLVKENKDKASIRLQLKRAGKTQNIEVKMPRKLKTANL
jgi:serine protease Do